MSCIGSPCTDWISSLVSREQASRLAAVGEAAGVAVFVLMSVAVGLSGLEQPEKTAKRQTPYENHCVPISLAQFVTHVGKANPEARQVFPAKVNIKVALVGGRNYKPCSP